MLSLDERLASYGDALDHAAEPVPVEPIIANVVPTPRRTGRRPMFTAAAAAVIVLVVASVALVARSRNGGELPNLSTTGTPPPPVESLTKGWRQVPYPFPAGSKVVTTAVTDGVGAWVRTGDGPTDYWTSPNGIDWQRRGEITSGPATVQGLAEHGGVLVAVGDTNPLSVLRSVDGGVTWAVTPVSFGEPAVTSTQVMQVMATDEGFTAVGYSVATGPTVEPSQIPYVWSSTDGMTWSAPLPMPDKPGMHVLSVSAQDHTVVVITERPNDEVILTTVDGGRTWNSDHLTGPEIPLLFRAVASDPAGVVAVGEDETGEHITAKLWRTTDGTSWHVIAGTEQLGTGAVHVTSLAAVKAGYAIGGPDLPTVRVSADSTIWSAVPGVTGDVTGFGDRILAHTPTAMWVWEPPSAQPQLDSGVVPNLWGMTLRDARAAAAAVGLTVDVDPATNWVGDDATVVGQAPGPNVTFNPKVIGVSTAAPVPSDDRQCVRARQPRTGSPDVLPKRGQSDLAAALNHPQVADIRKQVPAVQRVYLAHRNGDVWDDDIGHITVSHADDYWLIAEIPSAADCPTEPMIYGLPIVFIPTGSNDTYGTGVPPTSGTPESTPG